MKKLYWALAALVIVIGGYFVLERLVGSKLDSSYQKVNPALMQDDKKR